MRFDGSTIFWKGPFALIVVSNAIAFEWYTMFIKKGDVVDGSVEQILRNSVVKIFASDISVDECKPLGQLSNPRESGVIRLNKVLSENSKIEAMEASSASHRSAFFEREISM
jgi:hypothetical protein